MTEVRACIDDRCNRLGIKFGDAAKIIGVSDKTLRKKCNAPEMFTGSELKNMASILTRGQMESVLKEALNGLV